MYEMESMLVNELGITPLASFHVPQPKEPMVAVKLTDVDEAGEVSIQVVGPGLSQLEELTKQIEDTYSNQQPTTVKIVLGGIYCTEYNMDQCWYRVRVKEEVSSKQVHGKHYS